MSVADTVLDVLFFRNPHAEGMLYSILSGLTIAALFGVTSLRFVRRDSRLARYAARVTPALPWVLLQASIAILVSIEYQLEKPVTEWLAWDFTPLIHSIEGNTVQYVQDGLHYSAAGPVLDKGMAFVYTWCAMLLTLVPYLYMVFAAHVATVRRLAVTMFILWCVGLLFYYFFPVWEVWVTSKEPYNYGHVEHLLSAESPPLKEAWITRINLNNNFPSLHVASTTAMAVVLWRAGERVWFHVAWPIASLVAFSTIYLGIHWVLDVIAGIGLAFGASSLFEAWDRRQRARAPLNASLPPSGSPAPADDD